MYTKLGALPRPTAGRIVGVPIHPKGWSFPQRQGSPSTIQIMFEFTTDSHPEPSCQPAWVLYGVDFSSAPSRRKPIRVARGQLCGDAVMLEGLARLPTLAAWATWLQQPGPWAAGLDLPLGLPRELVDALAWPQAWHALMQHYTALSRPEIRAQFAAFCAARPAGGKWAHRACDGPAGSSPSMKWVNPPVAYMLHAGASTLLAAGVGLPGLHPGDPQRLALEAYPGMVARAVLGRRSYKSDSPHKQTPERQAARADLLAALCNGTHPWRLKLLAPAELHAEMLHDPTGDALDACICLMLLAWGSRQPRWGWPEKVDPLEGWILGA